MTMTVRGAQRRRDTESSDVTNTSERTGTARTTAPSASPSPSVESRVDRSVAEAARNARPLGDGILYVGMNEDSAGIELKALRASSGGNVTALLGHAGAKIETRFGSFDLASDSDVGRFVDGMVGYYTLTPAQGESVKTTLLSMHADAASDHDPRAGRDEIGRLALYFARAESGQGQMPSRLVLSGHSAGGQMWGDTTGEFKLDAVRDLATTFPNAAKQVEDVHFAGCFTHWALEDSSWKQAFPNLKTMWGYEGFSDRAPVGEMMTWERKTRGHADAITAHSLAAGSTAMAWSAANGVVGAHASATVLRAQTNDADPRFDAFVSGQTRVTDPHAHLIEADYAAYRITSDSADFTPTDQKDARRHADVLLRVRFYEQSVRGEFARTYGDEIGRAFEAVGLPAPDFATLSRKEALERIDDFRHAVPGRGDSTLIDTARRHLDALASLDDANAIPASWCH